MQEVGRSHREDLQQNSAGQVRLGHRDGRRGLPVLKRTQPPQSSREGRGLRILERTHPRQSIKPRGLRVLKRTHPP